MSLRVKLCLGSWKIFNFENSDIHRKSKWRESISHFPPFQPLYYLRRVELCCHFLGRPQFLLRLALTPITILLFLSLIEFRDFTHYCLPCHILLYPLSFSAPCPSTHSCRWVLWRCLRVMWHWWRFLGGGLCSAIKNSLAKHNNISTVLQPKMPCSLQGQRCSYYFQTYFFLYDRGKDHSIIHQ